jgi:putative colanic acid biosynthesis UDP-glucose lipid carrier transferase
MPKKRTLLIILKYLINPVFVSLILVGLAWFYLGRFEERYVALLVLLFLLVFQLIGSVDFESDNKSFWKKAATGLVLQWFLVVSLLLLIGFAFKVTNYYSRQVLFSWFLITPGVLIMAHWLLRWLLHRLSFAESEMSRAVIVGLSDLSRKLAYQFEQNPSVGVLCMGFFDDRLTERLSEYRQQQPDRLLGDISSVAGFVKTHNVQRIYIALPMTSQPRIMALLNNLRDTTASIYFVPDLFLFELIQAKFSSIMDIPIVAVCESPIIGINSVIKRIIDVTFSLSILLFVTPLMLLIAIGVKLSSRGPVLFKQRRYGLDGKEIVVYKFRSMTVIEDNEQVKQATREDPRITRFGSFLRKSSLDELPQFINVLQGRMSIVGPRPHAISHNEMYRRLIKGYMIRHKVKPGITGWAQVKGFRGETDTVEKMQSRIFYDIQYLQNWSIFIDLLIIFKTIVVIFNEENAY